MAALPRWEEPLSTIQKTRLALGVGLLGHDVLDQRHEGLDPGRGRALSEDLGPADVVGGQVGQRAAAVVFVVDPHRASFARCQGRVASAAGLDGGLLVGGDHVLVWAQGRTFPDAGVEVQYPAGLDTEVRVPDEDPGLVLPGFGRVLGQPAAHRGRRDRIDDTGGDGLASQLRGAPH